MAVFDGVNYIRRAGGLVGVVSSDAGTISAWIRPDTAPGSILVGGHSGGNRVDLDVETATGKITITLRDSTDTVLWTAKTAADYADGANHHIGVTWDLSATTAYLYVDGLLDQVDGTAATSGTVDYAGATDWVVGAASGGGSNFFDGGLFDVAFWPGIFLDFTTDNTLQLIVAIDENRLSTFPNVVKPVGYGRQGRYLGEPAMILFDGDFQRNLGVGGAFTATSTFDEDDASVAASAPNPYRMAPRWQTPGERWFMSEQSGIPYPRTQMTVEQREGLSSFGQLIALEEVDDTTRRERPGYMLNDLILGMDDEEDDAEFSR